MSTVIGIDLGTSTTEAAVIREGSPVMLMNFDGQVITPSVVGIDSNGEIFAGEKARERYLLEPQNIAIEIKRKMGTKEKIPLGNQEFTPTELSACLLKYVKEYASEWLGQEIDRAVISVPAHFDDLQRQATVEAGNQAGFSVERIINEPTAAALSYGLGHMEEESHILVYDLGGGTFDVTLLEMFGGVLEVKASGGDNMLGGKDFDECLINWLLTEFQAKHKINLRKNAYAMVKLKEKAEWCKKKLSSESSCRVLIPFIAEADGKPVDLDETVTVERFEEMITPYLERTHAPIDVVLADGGVTPEEIDKILLVGGSTRIPLVQRDIEEYLGKQPSVAVNPDYAVAEGTAIEAGIIEGTIAEEEALVMTDVNPYTLGVRTLNGITDDWMSVIIPRNVTIPVMRRERYYTCADDQTEARIEVYQGESDVASHNHFLGEFTIKGIPPRMRGEEAIDVEFSYDLNGMLSVSAVIVSTGAKASIDINMMKMQETDQRIDVSGWKNSPDAALFRSLIRKAERMLKNEKIKGDIFFYDDLEEAVYLLKKALIEEDIEAAHEMEEELKDILMEM